MRSEVIFRITTKSIWFGDGDIREITPNQPPQPANHVWELMRTDTFPEGNNTYRFIWHWRGWQDS